MNLNINNNFEQIFENVDDYGYYNADDDYYDTFSLSKPKQQKLTLRMINKLKKLRRTKEFDKSIKQELLGTMYGIENDSEE